MRPDLLLRQIAVCLPLIFLSPSAFAQCWPFSQKLIPDKAFNNAEYLGASIDYQDNIAVVGATQSDTLRSSSGIVYVFEFTNGNWKKIASLTPSDPRNYHYFGQQVVIKGEYIFVGDASRQNYHGAVYVYRKPPGGWTDMTETFILQPDHGGTKSFGKSLAVHGDNLLVGAPYSLNPVSNHSSGAAFLFKLQSGEWNKIATFYSPHPGMSTFGNNVTIGEDMAVVVASEETREWYTARGAVYVFEKSSNSDWTDSYPVARLTESSGSESTANLGAGLGIDETGETIFVTEITWTGNQGYRAIKIYRKPLTGWTNMVETHSYLSEDQSLIFFQTLQYNSPYLYHGGGKYVEIFAPDNNNEWTFSSPYAILKSSDFTYQQRFGTAITVSNGHVLVTAPGTVTLDRDEPIIPFKPAIYEFLIPSTGWVSGEYEEERSFTFMPTTATEYFFGLDIDIEGDIAIVGSPYDNRGGTKAGAVYVYRLVDFTWNKIATLTQSDGEPYDNFGRTVAISKDHIAVGTANKHYRDAEGKIIDHNLGAVYLFKKPAGGWIDMHESYKLTQFEGKVDYTDQDREDDQFGTTVALDYPYLIASRFDNGSRPNEGSVLVFNIGGEEPVREATLNPSYRGAINNFGSSLVIKDSIIAIGCGTTRFWMGEANVVFLYAKQGEQWTDATETARLVPSDNGATGYLPGIAFGYSLDITDDGSTIIVGAPGWFDGIIFNTTEYFKGAAYIFDRPAHGWNGRITEKAKLTVPGQPAFGCMGVDVHIEDRYAVIDAPQNFFYLAGQERPGPGKAFFYQKPDEGWSYKLPDKVIQGAESGSELSDYFGTAVDGVFGFLMVGAFEDDNENGVDAGSVYVYTEYPFINPAPSLVCENGAEVQLTAVPANGVWLGNGLASSNDGIFRPWQAGPGEHKIRYSADGCEASNTLLIRVKEVPKPGMIFQQDSIYFCGRDFVKLGTASGTNFTYAWHYSETGEFFTSLGIAQPTINADKTGFYQIVVSNECATVPNTIWAGDLFPNAGDDFSVCISQGSTTMSGNYESGTWSGPGLTASGMFDPGSAGVGIHELYFSVSPNAGCVYRDTVLASIRSLPPNVITPINLNSFCLTGSTTLSTHSNAQNSYSWYYGSAPETVAPVEGNKAEFVANSRGYYLVRISDGVCESESLYHLDSTPFLPGISPVFESITICHDQPTLISAEAIPGAHYQWFQHEGDVALLKKESTGSFSESINSSGRFTLTISSHGCEFRSNEMSIEVLPRDSIFIPNVITPNGDQWNESFDVFAQGIEDYTLKVFNRYGQQVWSGNKETPSWTAHDVPSGVYFWTLNYRSACANGKIYKGWLQVMKE